MASNAHEFDQAYIYIYIYMNGTVFTLDVGPLGWVVGVDVVWVWGSRFLVCGHERPVSSDPSILTSHWGGAALKD